MAEEEPAALADALNAINRANLRGLATADQWTDLVNVNYVVAYLNKVNVQRNNI